jgi:hypothetical protein
LTPAGEAALQHNLTATIDPESFCIIGQSEPGKFSAISASSALNRRPVSTSH